jgi:glucan 1,3-beta-glucosidase
MAMHRMVSDLQSCTISRANIRRPAIVDRHEYQVFDNGLVGMQNWQHRQYVCNNAPKYMGSDKWTVVGEWSAAETDCTTYFNGYLIGARYDGTYPGSSYHGSCTDKNNIADWDTEMRGDVRGYIEAQLETFEAVARAGYFGILRLRGLVNGMHLRYWMQGCFHSR